MKRSLVFAFVLLWSCVSANAQVAAPAVASNAPPLDMRSEIEKLRDSINITREELAELKPVTTVTQTVFYFVAGLSALLGFFGWRKFSDLDALVGEQVKLQLPRSQREFAEFEEMTKSAEDLVARLRSITKDYETALSNLKYVDVVSEEFDIEGKLHIAIEESTARRERTAEAKGTSSYEGTLHEKEWRTNTIALLSRLPGIVKKKNLDAGVLFNAAQVCRRMEQHEIAQQLTAAAYEKDPSSANKALMLSSIVKGEVGQTAQRAFSDLMQMVENLPRASPQIVLAEAWNAAVEQSRYADLVSAIDRLLAKQTTTPSTFAPSYAHVIRAIAIMSDSSPGALQAAAEGLSRAKEVMMTETMDSSWFESSLSEIAKCERNIMRTAEMHAILMSSMTTDVDGAPAPSDHAT